LNLEKILNNFTIGCCSCSYAAVWASKKDGKNENFVPHGRTIKVYKKPLMRVKVKWIGSFNPFHVVTIFLADESRA
jgi:hypothetical protein